VSTPDARRGTPDSARFLILVVPVAALLVGLRAALVPDLGRRNLEYVPEMVTGPAVESQTIAPRLPGGLSQQPLVAGVVPRGRALFRFGPGDDEAQRAGRELLSPFAADDARAAARGAEVYASHCVPCHGTAGDGQGPAVLRGMLPPPPFQGASAMQMADGQMFHVLKLGRGNMPAMRARLDDADLWSVIRHVRGIQAPTPPESPPADTAPDAAGPGEGGGR